VAGLATFAYMVHYNPILIDRLYYRTLNRSNKEKI